MPCLKNRSTSDALSISPLKRRDFRANFVKKTTPVINHLLIIAKQMVIPIPLKKHKVTNLLTQ